MEDLKLFELAVQLACAEINTGVIAPAIRGRDDMIQDRIKFHHDQLRSLWNEQHRGGHASFLDT